MSMAISRDDKMDFALCDIMVGFPISSQYIMLKLIVIDFMVTGVLN